MSNSSIPDCVSIEHLTDLLNAKTNMLDATPEKLIEYVVDTVEAAEEKIGTTFAYKLIADYCLHQLEQIHKAGYTNHIKDGNVETAFLWANDAARLEDMMTTLRDIQCGKQDFQAPID